MKRHKKKVSSKEISKDFKKREANKFNKTHSGKLTQSKIEEHIKLLEKVKEEISKTQTIFWFGCFSLRA